MSEKDIWSRTMLGMGGQGEEGCEEHSGKRVITAFRSEGGREGEREVGRKGGSNGERERGRKGERDREREEGREREEERERGRKGGEGQREGVWDGGIEGGRGGQRIRKERVGGKK